MFAIISAIITVALVRAIGAVAIKIAKELVVVIENSNGQNNSDSP